VIDLLDKKASLLAEQVTALEQENTTLLRENRNLKLENENLKGQLQNARPKGDELDQKTQDILKYIFDKGDDFTDPEIARRFQIQLNVAAYHTDILCKKKFVMVTRLGGWMGITDAGRKHVVESGWTG
jgi:regulator of replication initiation timing